jgi:vacuolar-type H+-ATPase subunit I/STV1
MSDRTKSDANTSNAINLSEAELKMQKKEKMEKIMKAIFDSNVELEVSKRNLSWYNDGFGLPQSHENPKERENKIQELERRIKTQEDQLRELQAKLESAASEDSLRDLSIEWYPSRNADLSSF